MNSEKITMRENPIVDKSFAFSLRVIELYKYLVYEKKEYVMSKQLLRSGTSIGANVREAVVSQSCKEFVSKMNISLKEAHETDYWLELLFRSGLIDKFHYPHSEIDELIRLITSIIKTSNLNRDKS